MNAPTLSIGPRDNRMFALTLTHENAMDFCQQIQVQRQRALCGSTEERVLHELEWAFLNLANHVTPQIVPFTPP